MGFSLNEMGQFTQDEFIDLLEIYIESLGTGEDEKEVVHERAATKEEIDAFFK